MRERVLSIIDRYLGYSHRPSGESNIMLMCPFEGRDSERPNNKPFSVNLDLGLFHCFSCHVSGPIPYLLRLLGVSDSTIEAETNPLKEELALNKEFLKTKQRAAFVHKDPFQAKTVLSPVILAPYNWCPPQLTGDGFDATLLHQMRIGVDLQKQRITYPVFDIYGNLAGIVGGRTQSWQEPKYKVYESKNKIDPYTQQVVEGDFGPWFSEKYPDYAFRNHEYLWNFERVYPRMFFTKEVQTLIVVEGFKACLWLLQNGYWNTVAIMGSKLSYKQKQLLARLEVNYLLFLDNDSAGWEGTMHDGRDLYVKTAGVSVARYPPESWGCQPDHLRSQELLHQAIEGAIPYPIYARKGA